MLRQLDLPLQDRRQEQRLVFFYKVVRGLVPAINPDSYVTKTREGRMIKPVQRPDFVQVNIVENLARNNSECFNINGEIASGQIYKTW